MADDSDNFFGPPAEPVEVFCLHCGNVYCSSEMKFVPAHDGACVFKGVQGDWVCPAPGCDGIGYRFDIHSVEEWEANSCDDEECEHESFDNPEPGEAYIEELVFDEDENLVPLQSDFLPPASEDPEEAFREIQRDMNWWDTHDFACVRIWRMWVHFRPHAPPEQMNDPQQSFERFNEDDIPF